ncbi:class I SAM-dependent methyltransferase [Tardiphaga sp. 20_F10_N6_6]|jgi:predicted O-methyltransferase YrrM|uniref:class I SAM-dependent methyltransferase n=1 Tax=Tardiphaga sp. 20_F10_N6_6 TaxID=3240788 RepID=UPI003F899A63
MAIGNWREFYSTSDRDARISPRRVSRVFINNYASHWTASDKSALITECKGFSMLHQETLMLLSYFAKRANGAVLELGAYLGGSTIPIAKALQETGGGLQITVEPGGSHPNHPDYPTTDILRDLKSNIKKYGVEGIVNLIEGYSDADDVVERVARVLDGRKIDLLFIDSDGKVGRDMDIYQKYLAPGCVIVLDDYMTVAADAADKEVGVRSWVASAADAGIVTELGVYPWGTWFGQYTDAP